MGLELRPLDGDDSLSAVDGGGGVDGGSAGGADAGTTSDAAPDAAIEPGSCELDSDDDGVVDCEDQCREDPAKTAPGTCGCMVSETDTDADGQLDCVDSCGGSNDAAYQPDASCGVGYCQTSNTPSSCVSGVESACVPGAPLSASDTTCDGVDDDCSGEADEDYVRVTACGVGSCRARATASSCSGGAVTACQPAAPLANNDVTSDGIDDDCDGAIDEDACVPHTETYGVGSHSSSPGSCTRVTVKLWGAGGASGDTQGGYWGSTVAGQGGAGGYAQGVFTVSSSSSVQIVVGRGGQGCGGPGTSANAAYSGGTGATTRGGDGTRGADGSVMGGNGGSPSGGGRGGNGSFGGGGGGAGSGPAYAPFGSGGGGGAASLLVIGSTRMVAGGGGGGAGVGTNIATAGFSGGNGGTGCSGTGGAPTSAGGGGGGGGVCQGGTVAQPGSGRTPYNAANDLAAGAAVGANNSGDCNRGGDGYAIVSYAP